jgi:hypothetical protein
MAGRMSTRMGLQRRRSVVAVHNAANLELICARGSYNYFLMASMRMNGMTMASCRGRRCFGRESVITTSEDAVYQHMKTGKYGNEPIHGRQK